MPLVDQQLGGIIMKVTGFVVFGIPLTVAFFRWFQQENGPSVAQPHTRPRNGGERQQLRKGTK